MFQSIASNMIDKGRKEHPDEPYYINNDVGTQVILPARLAQEVRNHDGLSFAQFLNDYFHNGMPGFEPFVGAGREDELFQRVARKQLTRLLSEITQPLSEEASFALDLNLGSSTDWTVYTMGPVALDVIARVTSRIFLGDVLCRDKDWLEITKNFTIQGFIATEALKRKPKMLRGIYNRFDPMCVELRNTIQRARDLLGPVIEKRRKRREEAIARGEKVSVMNDAIEWFEEEAAGIPYDPVSIQMTISTSSIHSTTDLLLKTMYKIAEHPGLAEELRNEILQVIGTRGWKKTTLHDLKLLDSVLKETQRLEPISSVTLNRFTVKDVTFSDGTFIPKGVRVGTDTGYRLSPEYYDSPLKFDPYRFYKWRDTTKDSLAHLVSTSPQQMGFGHGQHACPGRFFVANEIKIVFVHLLLKYEWKIAEGSSHATLTLGLQLNANPTTEVMLRRRSKIEIDIDAS
ncbi:cytochrome P450 [Colletotrichum navitas]|uniref:Cytochrome P450 n=1 Tax=Colletotrichum navitas TaxID=681940 RepID=A0AAD8UW35_9PEZI|nr:cytochrome P450 [Colletotrichum navitas]KAK1561572.1 cytochrome P450 [Colletotrichum navitas]